ncbi:MAG TPA: M24 family metallopeptidase [Gaiellaceae bacterium]|nr:M24 family metallopeptidase [Gaiellaceae bacterium]
MTAVATSLPTPTALAAEAERKRALALDAAAGVLVTSRPADVRWLLCGRGRPVDDSAPRSPYTVALDGERARVLYPDIEDSRVREEEGLDELGYELVPYPWHQGHGLEESPSLPDGLRIELGDDELARYRVAGAAVANAVRETLFELGPQWTELRAAAELAARAHERGFTTPVVLVGGEDRQRIHRHPLPTEAPLGRHALLAITAEREGLHVSMTRLVSFGRPPHGLEALVHAAAEIDAAYLSGSRPGVTLGDIFAAGSQAYAAQGFPEEWRRHHQGGLTGYRGREVFAVPNESTAVPAKAAVAWNPSLTGGAKSEDTVLVTAEGIDVITRTPDLGEIETTGGPRPAIVVLDGA